VKLCIAIVVVCGCTSQNKQEKDPAKIEAERNAIVQESAEIDRRLKALDSQKQQIYDELARREALWRRQVSARHPEWTPERRERQLAILSEKWWKSNRSKDADTVEEMKKHGSRLWYDLDLVEADYWDITRAMRFQFERHEIERPIGDEVNSLHGRKAFLSEKLKRLVSEAQ
jgi:hypothetical protein